MHLFDLKFGADFLAGVPSSLVFTISTTSPASSSTLARPETSGAGSGRTG